MTGEVLRIKLSAKFELWCFVSTVVKKCSHYAKPPEINGRGTNLKTCRAKDDSNE